VYSLTHLIILGAVAALVGLGLGWLLGRRLSSEGQKYRDMERKLDQVLQDKKAYEDEVVEHFSDTAQLLNKLTESYRDVHNHLAQGAGSLCQGQGPVALDRLENRAAAAENSEIPAHLADIQPPLDYAPKTSPDEKGMLNEEFGLERNAAESPSQDEEPARN
jgi:uncharacterized membrane-anchored protein YhcB (DUF1043 family)